MITEFGKEIRKLRIDRGLNMQDMAKGTDFAASYLSAVETGKKRVSEKLLEAIHAYFKLDQDEMTRIRELAEKARPEVKLNVSESDDLTRNLVTQFARQFSELTADKKEQILKIMEEDPDAPGVQGKPT